jgi:hypothetical protein
MGAKIVVLPENESIRSTPRRRLRFRQSVENFRKLPLSPTQRILFASHGACQQSLARFSPVLPIRAWLLSELLPNPLGGARGFSF